MEKNRRDGYKVVLLAAGHGKRLMPLTRVLPKCLMPINGHPLLAYWLSALRDAGLGPVTVNLHHHAPLVAEWLEGSEFAENTRLFPETTLLGTAGTLRANKDFLGDDPALVIHGDNLCSADIAGFVHAHENRPKGALMTMMTFEAQHPETCGILKTDAQGIVREFHEKVPDPPGRLANAAIYAVEPDVISMLDSTSGKITDLSTGLIPRLMGRVFTYHNGSYHRDIGTVKSYMDANKDFPGMEVHDGKGSWRLFCERKRDAFLLFGEALSEALSAETVSLKNFMNGNFNIPPGNLLVNCTGPISNFDDIALAAHGGPIKREKLTFLFESVPSGFRSGSFYRETGLSNTAFSASKEWSNA